MKQLKTGVSGLHVSLGESWMAVFHNTSNGVSVSDVQLVCTERDANNTRVLTICSLLKSEGDCLTHTVGSTWYEYDGPRCIK